MKKDDLYDYFRVCNMHKSNLSNFIPIEGVEVKVLDGCNRACRFCVNEDFKGKELNIIDVDLFLQRLNTWIEDTELDEKPAIIYLTGGEPLLALYELQKIIAFAKTKDIATRLVTNGTLLSPEIIEKLSDVGLTGIKITYTTSDSERLLQLVGGADKNDPQLILENIKAAKQAGLWVFVRIGIGRHNYDEVYSIYKAMKEAKVDVVQFKPWVASGLAEENNDELLLKPQELDELFDSLSNMIGKTDIKSDKPEITVSCYPPARKYGFIVKDCANIAKIYCESDGATYICNFADEYMGNWKTSTDSFKAILKRRRDLYSDMIDNNGIMSCPSRLNWSEQKPVVSPKI